MVIEGGGVRMKANLVCKGGGVKGIAIIGAMQCLEEAGYEWVQSAGSSVGALIAALNAVGYTAKEMKLLIDELDFKTFVSKKRIPSIPFIGDRMSILIFKGIYDTQPIEEFLKIAFEIKKKQYFKDITRKGVCSLKIIATDISLQQLIVLPHDLKKYGIDPMSFDLATAVGMSIRIPFFYYPMKLTYGNKQSLIVDGGIASNFPVWAIDRKYYWNYPTIGLNLLSDKREDTSKYINPITYTLDVINMALYTNEEIYFSHDARIKMIHIPTLEVDTRDFKLTQQTKNNLYQAGYEAAYAFLEEQYKRTGVLTTRS